MATFKKNHPKKGGRKKGTPNKITKTVREVFLNVFNEIQSDRTINLKAFAKKYPRDFYQLASKLIPTEITGANGKDLFNFKHLSEAELDMLISKLQKTST